MRLLSDGYTVQGKIHARKHQHDEFQGGVRLMLPEERTVVLWSLTQTRGPAHDLVIDTVCGRLDNWNAVDAEGRPAPKDREHVRRLHPLVLERLFNIILGDAIFDEYEDDQDSKAARDAQLKSAISGRPKATERAEADSGN